jgi:hypothetical protein
MGRYRYRRGSRRSFGASAVSKRQELTSTFGGIDQDVERLFLGFDRGELEQLFTRYEKDYGRPAATYARTAYPKWKDRSVKLSGQTAERLLNLVPPLLPFETRFELVKKLRNANFRRANEHIRTTPERWQQDLGPAIARVVSHGNTSSLSDYVKKRVSWLANGDVATTEKLLLAADQEEAINRLAYLNAEFIRIETMMAQLKNLETAVSHSIELPQGSIHVHIETPKVSTWQKLMNWLG